MHFTLKLTEADLSDVRKLTRAGSYWLNLSLYGVGLIFVMLRAWRLSLGFLARTPPNLQLVAIIWVVIVGGIPWTIYMVRRGWARELTQLNATRPDQMSLTNDGVKCDGPDGATALVPWRNFKAWREGRRVILVERREGNRFVILPVAQLSEIERLPIRQFLQSHIPLAS